MSARKVPAVPIRRLWVRNYRSLLDVSLSLDRLTVVVGANGTGKSNLYRSLLLLSRSADGRLASTLLEEGGMPSALWAGERQRKKSEPVRLVLGVHVDDMGYELALGLPPPTGSVFRLDPEIKEEAIWVGDARNHHSTIADRAGVSGTAIDVDGGKATFVTTLNSAEALLGQVGDPARFPELHSLRERLRRWRFYHQFPTDSRAPARAPRPAVRTTVLANDGSDLAAAFATILEIGDGAVLREAIDAAFPGTTLHVIGDATALTIALQQPGLKRPTSAGELSDGTLRYLYLVAALLTPRPPDLLVLNEPETSLHPSLLPPLANLVAEATDRSQIIVTTHAEAFADRLVDVTGCAPTTLRLDGGRTVVESVEGG